MTSKDDIKGLVSLQFLRPCLHPKVNDNKINTHTVVALNSSQKEKAESSQLAGLHSSNVTRPPEALFIQILLALYKT
jgi:hypothetical protein